MVAEDWEGCVEGTPGSGECGLGLGNGSVVDGGTGGGGDGKAVVVGLGRTEGGKMEMGWAVTGHTGPVGVVSVEDGVVIGAEAFEESCFSGGVGGHVAVVVEVILSEVGEDGDARVEVIGALLVEGVGGGFVDAGFAGGVADVGEVA